MAFAIPLDDGQCITEMYRITMTMKYVLSRENRTAHLKKKDIGGKEMQCYISYFGGQKKLSVIGDKYDMCPAHSTLKIHSGLQ